MTAYLIAAVVVAAALLYVVGNLYFSERKRSKEAAAALVKERANSQALRDEIKFREADRNATEKALDLLRRGSASDRLGASIDVLRDISGSGRDKTASDNVAESQPPASDGN